MSAAGAVPRLEAVGSTRATTGCPSPLRSAVMARKPAFTDGAVTGAGRSSARLGALARKGAITRADTWNCADPVRWTPGPAASARSAIAAAVVFTVRA